jgi:HAD superfamily hydrolase (TIGR01509 family)
LLNQPRSFEAVLFDLDGTLTESEKQLYAAWKQLVARAGADFTGFDYGLIIGRAELECCRIVSEFYGLNKDPRTWNEEYMDILRVLDEQLTLRPGADLLLASLYVLGIPMALVTSANDEHASISLRRFRLEDCFKAVVTADTPGLAARKPDPAPYLLGASLLGVDPKRCVAFEDSPSGARAARAAGCYVIGCPHEYSPARNIVAAHVILTDIADFTPEMVPQSW